MGLCQGASKIAMALQCESAQKWPRTLYSALSDLPSPLAAGKRL